MLWALGSGLLDLDLDLDLGLLAYVFRRLAAHTDSQRVPCRCRGKRAMDGARPNRAPDGLVEGGTALARCDIHK